ncbi:unnamed protein product [Linum tenue]|uniref:Uncharacterized protein n=1 Tax=Linum tenue TaxID=586396 RepID=A0AAV0Q896_9ROSI|nr:unnamed protein product [Linum tenue]CAI0540588.1 unnamed protein product [Linum tenue]
MVPRRDYARLRVEVCLLEPSSSSSSRSYGIQMDSALRIGDR